MLNRNYLKEKLESGQSVIGTWSIIPSTVTTEIIASTGVDFIIIDAEHGPISFETAQDMVRILKKEQQCVLVICLSHLGYKYRDEPTKICDLKLAELTQDIDLIIGGHTHTFLDKPTVAKNLVGKEVLVNQVGCYGINLGRIDFYLDNNKAKAFEGKSIIV